MPLAALGKSAKHVSLGEIPMNIWTPRQIGSTIWSMNRVSVDGVTLAVEAVGLVASGPAADLESLAEGAEVALCREWIQAFCRPSKDVTTNRSSYGYKHDVERWVRSKSGASHYISNGAFILAALAEGFRCAPTEPGSANAHFNMSIQQARQGESPHKLAAGGRKGSGFRVVP